MSEAFFHNLYVGCGIFAIVMFAVTVVLFFVFDIFKAFMDLTGLSAKRGVKELEEESDFTTRLNRSKRERGRKKGKGGKQKIMTYSGSINYQMAETAAASQAASDNNVKEANANHMPDKGTELLEEGTQLLSGENNDTVETQLLSEENKDFAETQLLSGENKDFAETQLLSDGKESFGETQLLSEETQDVSNYSLVIVRKILMVHTDEVI